MNILIVNFEYPPLGGGGGVATRDIAEELSKRHCVHVVTSGSFNDSGNDKKLPFLLHRVPTIGRSQRSTASLLSMTSFVFFSFFKLLFLCASHAFDVINAQFVLPSGIPASIVSRIYNIPFVLSFIGGDVYDPTKRISPHRYKILQWLIRLIANQAIVCTAISHDTKDRVRHIHHVKNDIVVTHLGIHPLHIRDSVRSNFHIPDDEVVCITVGRLIKRKNVESIIRALSRIDNIFLAIVGDGPEQNYLDSLSKSLGIADRVRFFGFISEQQKQELLFLSDIYISASKHEGFGLVFLEAMDAGLPVIAPAEGGQTDFLAHGRNALLVDPCDIDAVAGAIKKLAGDKDLRRSYGEQGKRIVHGFYIGKTVARFEEILVRAAATKRV